MTEEDGKASEDATGKDREEEEDDDEDGKRKICKEGCKGVSSSEGSQAIEENITCGSSVKDA